MIVQRVSGEQRGVAGAYAFTGVAYTWCLDYYCVTIHLCCPIFEFNSGARVERCGFKEGGIRERNAFANE